MKRLAAMSKITASIATVLILASCSQADAPATSQTSSPAASQSSAPEAHVLANRAENSDAVKAALLTSLAPKEGEIAERFGPDVEVISPASSSSDFKMPDAEDVSRSECLADDLSARSIPYDEMGGVAASDPKGLTGGTLFWTVYRFSSVDTANSYLAAVKQLISSCEKEPEADPDRRRLVPFKSGFDQAVGATSGQGTDAEAALYLAKGNLVLSTRSDTSSDEDSAQIKQVEQMMKLQLDIIDSIK